MNVVEEEGKATFIYH